MFRGKTLDYFFNVFFACFILLTQKMHNRQLSHLFSNCRNFANTVICEADILQWLTKSWWLPQFSQTFLSDKFKLTTRNPLFSNFLSRSHPLSRKSDMYNNHWVNNMSYASHSYFFLVSFLSIAWKKPRRYVTPKLRNIISQYKLVY